MKTPFKPLGVALRPAHWIKNLFIFCPLIFGHKLTSLDDTLKIFIGFLLFCGASSTVYLINDLIDLDADRRHPTKRLRPIASRQVSLELARAAAAILGGGVLLLSFGFNRFFGWTVLLYLVSNTLYSRWLKHWVIIDVFCLGWFFLLRIIAGTVLAQVEYSHWMISMTFLLALFLGFNKRRQEVAHANKQAMGAREVLSSYSTYFIDQMIAVCTSSIVVVYMLYTVDERTVRLVGNQHLLITIPCVYYGIFRYLYLIHKKEQEGDPTQIVLTDFPTQINLFLWLILCIGVIYYKL